ncbi:MAG: methionyl-tRNA formyltransferase [Treponemataceae bacterium]|nr:methionyl-tRNA formyltransferase [Treponemataceae bacterium]
MLKIVYAASPEPAVKPLQVLAENPGFEIVAVITNPASSQKRSKEPVPTPVAVAAEELGIKTFTPEKLSEIADDLAALKPDILVCFAYGKIFSTGFLSIFPLGGINLHPSLLPLYRGCAPVPAAILAKDAVTGITVQRLAKKMDSGNILLQGKLELNGTETTESLLATVAELGGAYFERVLTQIAAGTVTEVEQDESKATYCGMLNKEDGLIDWNASALDICAKVRAFYPWPSTFTQNGGNTLLIHGAKVLAGEQFAELPPEIADAEKSAKPGTVLGMSKKHGIIIKTGDGLLAVTNLQWKAKKAMDYKSFMNGSRDFIGSVCGNA